MGGIGNFLKKKKRATVKVATLQMFRASAILQMFRASAILQMFRASAILQCSFSVGSGQY